MPYPKKYVGHYPALAQYLSKNGYRVYPMEMFCKPVPVMKTEKRWCYGKQETYQKRHWLYGNVDVAVWKDGKLYAFEVKHRGDKVKTALLQTANYAKYFDYTCAVVYDLKELMKYRKQFQDLGVGTYYVDGEFKLLDEPKLQMPDEKEHAKLYDRFLRNTGMKKRENPFNKSLRK